jgi:hypothetical protein
MIESDLEDEIVEDADENKAANKEK